MVRKFAYLNDYVDGAGRLKHDIVLVFHMDEEANHILFAYNNAIMKMASGGQCRYPPYASQFEFGVANCSTWLGDVKEKSLEAYPYFDEPGPANLSRETTDTIFFVDLGDHKSSVFGSVSPTIALEELLHLSDMKAIPMKTGTPGWNPDGRLLHGTDFTWTTLTFAAWAGDEDIITKLLDGDADPNEMGRGYPLLNAIAAGHTAVACKLIKHMANVDVQEPHDGSRFTGLMYVARGGSCTQELIDYLLKPEADIELRDYSDRTALIIAADKNNVNMVKRLIDRKAKVNAQDKHGTTALMYATTNANADMVRGARVAELASGAAAGARIATLLREAGAVDGDSEHSAPTSSSDEDEDSEDDGSSGQESDANMESYGEWTMEFGVRTRLSDTRYVRRQNPY